MNQSTEQVTEHRAGQWAQSTEHRAQGTGQLIQHSAQSSPQSSSLSTRQLTGHAQSTEHRASSMEHGCALEQLHISIVWTFMIMLWLHSACMQQAIDT